MKRTRSAMLLVAVAVAGASLGAALMPSLLASSFEGLALLAILGAALERYGTELFSRTRVSVSAIAVLAAGVLYGESGVIPVAMSVALAAWLFRSRPVSRLIFNNGQLALAGVAAAASFRALTELLPAGDLSAAVAAGTAGLAMWAVSSALVGAMLAATTSRPFFGIVQENYVWLAVHFAVMGLVALGLALTYTDLGLLGFAAFVAPVGALALALQQGTAKARQAVGEAQEARQMLAEMTAPSRKFAA